MEGAHTDITSDIFGDSGRVGSHTQVDFGPYAEAEQRVGRVRLTAGLRLDGIFVVRSPKAAVLSSRIGAALPSGGRTRRASAGRGIPAPTLSGRYLTTRALCLQS